jgi:hypothetical protein
MSKLLIVVILVAIARCSAYAKDGLLNSSVEEVAEVLGQPISHETGKVSGVAYERYHFETEDWKTTVLFVDGKAQKLDTEKCDGSPVTDEEKTAVFDRYDLPNTGQNSKIRGWRELAENHFIRGDGRVRITMRSASITVFLDDLPRDFW